MAASSSSSSGAKFRVPLVSENPTGWGPSDSVTLPRCHDGDIPYAPFSKAGRLGKIADWTATYGGRVVRRTGVADGMNEAFLEEETEDTTDFQLVMENKTSKKTGARRYGMAFSGARNTFRFRRGGRPGAPLSGTDGAGDGLRGKAMKQFYRAQKGRKQELARQRWATYARPSGSGANEREPSVAVQPTWALSTEFDFDALRRASVPARDVAVADEDLLTAGALPCFDSKYERPVKKEETLARRFVASETLPLPVSTSNDPLLKQLADASDAQVFITDELLSVIMTADRSVYPWDLVATRVGSKLFVDKRPTSTISMDSVNETANEPPRDDPHNPTPAESTSEINAPAPLALEATRVCCNYQQMVVQASSAPVTAPLRPEPQSNPFEAERAAHLARAYRYRQWTVGDVKLVVRSTLDAARQVKDHLETLCVRALLEFDPRPDGMNWRQKLTNQPGAIIATEMKNNSAKLARWLLQAHLSGADGVLIGYVSRTTYRLNTAHVILGNQLYKPHELVSQLSLDINHCWGVFLTVVSSLLQLPEGKYCLLRESGAQLSIYQVPADETFEKPVQSRTEELDLLASAIPATPVHAASSSSQ